MALPTRGCVGDETRLEILLEMQMRGPRRRLFDTFIFYNELDMLELRLQELAPIVDVFVLVESTHTFSGVRKPLFFAENQERFAKYLHRIVHVTVTDMPGTSDDTSANGSTVHSVSNWDREAFQRNAIARGLNIAKVRDDDIVMVSDVDEVPNLSAVTQLVWNWCEGLYTLDMHLHYYRFGCIVGQSWINFVYVMSGEYYHKNVVTGATTLNFLRQQNKSKIRVANAGWHLSYFGDVEWIQNKIRNFSHTEFQKDEFLSEENIRRALDIGTDLFGMDARMTNTPPWALQNLPHTPCSRFLPSHDLKVWYGSDNMYIDVTSKFIEAYSVKDPDGSKSTPERYHIGTEKQFYVAFGDPLPGVPKELIILAHRKRIIVKESSMVEMVIRIRATGLASILRAAALSKDGIPARYDYLAPVLIRSHTGATDFHLSACTDGSPYDVEMCLSGTLSV